MGSQPASAPHQTEQGCDKVTQTQNKPLCFALGISGHENYRFSCVGDKHRWWTASVGGTHTNGKETRRKLRRRIALPMSMGNLTLFSRIVTFKFVQLVQAGTILFSQRAGYCEARAFRRDPSPEPAEREKSAILVACQWNTLCSLPL